MLRASEASFRVRIDAQLEDQGWDVLDANAVRFDERRSVLGIVALRSEALRKEEAVVQPLLAGTFNRNQGSEGAKEGVAFA
jgi:hypothetical protein